MAAVQIRAPYAVRKVGTNFRFGHTGQERLEWFLMTSETFCY